MWWYHLASLCICSPSMEILFPLTTVWILTPVERLSQFLRSPLMDGGGFPSFPCKHSAVLNAHSVVHGVLAKCHSAFPGTTVHSPRCRCQITVQKGGPWASRSLRWMLQPLIVACLRVLGFIFNSIPCLVSSSFTKSLFTLFAYFSTGSSFCNWFFKNVWMCFANKVFTVMRYKYLSSVWDLSFLLFKVCFSWRYFNIFKCVNLFL